YCCIFYFFFFSSRRRHTRSKRDWSSDVCSSDLFLCLKNSFASAFPIPPVAPVISILLFSNSIKIYLFLLIFMKKLRAFYLKRMYICKEMELLLLGPYSAQLSGSNAKIGGDVVLGNPLFNPVIILAEKLVTL